MQLVGRTKKTFQLKLNSQSEEGVSLPHYKEAVKKLIETLVLTERVREK